jgi:hypothetical protein
MGGGADGDAQARPYLRALFRIHDPKGHEHMTEIRATNRWIDGAHDANMMRGV